MVAIPALHVPVLSSFSEAIWNFSEKAPSVLLPVIQPRPEPVVCICFDVPCLKKVKKSGVPPLHRTTFTTSFHFQPMHLLLFSAVPGVLYPRANLMSLQINLHSLLKFIEGEWVPSIRILSALSSCTPLTPDVFVSDSSQVTKPAPLLTCVPSDDSWDGHGSCSACYYFSSGLCLSKTSPNLSYSCGVAWCPLVASFFVTLVSFWRDKR